MTKKDIQEKFNQEIIDKMQQEKEKEEEEKEVNVAELFSGFFQKDPETQEKDKIIEILFEHKDLRKISDVSRDEITDITVLLTFAKDVDTPLINFFCETRLALSLSKDRKSREEVVEIYKTNMMSEMGMFPQSPMGDSPSRFDRLKERLSL